MGKVLLIGKNGQVGWELVRTCSTLGEVVAVDFPEVDLAKPAELRDMIRSVKPTVLINAAAYTDVDKAESEPELARTINALAPEVMAEEIRKLKGVFVHYSTDYVFDGKKNNPYIEADIPTPLNVYGASKLEGEKMVQAAGGAYLIFRTSWVYSLRRPSFVTKVLEWTKIKKELRIVDDQISSPTWARTLAEATAQVLAQGFNNGFETLAGKFGLYHLTSAGHASRYEWAKAILELDPHPEEQVTHKLAPARSDEFPTPAMRPHFSALECSSFEAIFHLQPVPWKEALALALGG